jgi:hypothetical protein
MDMETRTFEMSIKSDEEIPEKVRKELEKAIESILKAHHIKYTFEDNYPALEPDDVHG